MELFSITIEGYRRFKTAAMLRTNGKLVAIVGPNEAGKSSILRAIHHVGNDEALNPAEISRGQDSAGTKIVARFLLNDEELARANITGPRWMTLTKRATGQRNYGFIPHVPGRDISHREKNVEVMRKAMADDLFRAHVSEVDPNFFEQVEETIASVLKGPANLNPAIIGQLSHQRAFIESIQPDTKYKIHQDAVNAWGNLYDKEVAKSPTAYAVDALHRDVPPFLVFDQDARSLASSYNIESLREEVPTALSGLFRIAEIDADAILNAIDNQSAAALTTVEHRANRNLEKRFKEAWQQSGVHVAFRISRTEIEVQVVNEQTEFTDFDERSDGLRQFVALQPFAMQTTVVNPILLIDEAEQKLHYDAQADLVQMLARQTVSPKIIYTTHSAGCLPEDLGNGVRLAHQSKAAFADSEIKNKFWANDDRGFMPLLFGMGASTLAFFPTRRAVLVEGPVDMLLYPTIFREIIGKQTLGFQFVPGLSAASESLLPMFSKDALNVAYLADGDEGGIKIRDRLIKDGVPEQRIVILRNSDKSAVEIEDFVDPVILCTAASRLIARYYDGVDHISANQVGNDRRMTKLEELYMERTGNELPKIELAYELLDVIDDNPSNALIDKKRKKSFEKIVDQVMALFD